MSSTRKAMKGPKGRLHRVLLDPFFPMAFVLRNLANLQTELGWAKLPYRLKKACFARVIAERALFFLEIRKWRLAKNDPGLERWEDRRPWLGGPEAFPGYCTHCGACCEIASGLRDFPHTDGIPESWKEVFGEGLGRGHRFCAFLLEEKPRGKSHCAIHPWRPNPCRAFERDECEYLTEHQGLFQPWCDGRRSVARRWLLHLIDGAKLPRRRPDFPAKRPKLFKLHGI